MENLNNHFEDCRKISERIVQEFQKINMDSKQRLQEINRRLEIMANNSLKEIPNEEAIVTAGNDAIQTSNLEKDIQDFMKNLDVSAINEETIAKIDAEYQDQMEQKMSDKEVSRFVDEEQNNLEEINIQQEPKEKEIVSNVFLDEKIIQLCKEKSVKPKTKIKKKAKKKKLNVAGFIVAASVSIAAVATPIAAHAINMAYPNQMIEEATENYMENIFNPNTEQHFNSEKMDTDHYHDLINIMVETKEEYENPIVGFYLVYNNLDKYCKNYKLDEIFYNFNLVYKTDYTSLEDFLQKNNFKNIKEFEKYVGYELSKLSTEERGRGM